MKVKSESEVAQSCPTLGDPMDCSPPGCPVPGIFQARALAWGAISFSEIFTTVTIIFITMFLIIIIYKSAQEPQGERVLEWLIVIMFHSMILK